MKIIRFVTEKNDGLRTKTPEIVVRSFPTCFSCTHIVFVIIFSNLKLIIFEDQGKYWHILLLSALL